MLRPDLRRAQYDKTRINKNRGLFSGADCTEQAPQHHVGDRIAQVLRSGRRIGGTSCTTPLCGAATRINKFSDCHHFDLT